MRNTTPLFFLIKGWSTEKTIEKNRFFSVDYVKINELDVAVHT